MKASVRTLTWGVFLLAALGALPAIGGVGAATARSLAPPAANDWRVGNTVSLSRGTQIWVAPDLVGSCYHTIVPVDDWAVKVTDGPRQSLDKRTWYDTSRRAAGDPSGGTGWVNIEQVDQHPGVQDTGRYCPPGGTSSGGVTPAPTPTTGDHIWPPPFVIVIIHIWLDASLPLKIGILAVALLLLAQTPRLRVFGSPILIGFVRAILWGLLLGGATDLLRPLWQAPWLVLPAGYRAFDPALVLLLVPLVWWGFGYLLAVAGIGIVIVALVVLVLGIFIYLAYVLELLRSF